jgi:transcriptional regulator NrdR family protein
MSPRLPIARDVTLGILCPYCGSAEHKVTHKNPLQNGRTARRHKCLHCQHPFYSDQFVRIVESGSPRVSRGQVTR